MATERSRAAKALGRVDATQKPSAALHETLVQQIADLHREVHALCGIASEVVVLRGQVAECSFLPKLVVNANSHVVHAVVGLSTSDPP